jgi:methylmalonyl-CoA/ethylmalonyl-CoA epimerase
MSISKHIKGVFAVVLAVNNLDEAIKSYENIGFECTDRSLREEWGLEAAQMKVGETSVIEVLSPVDMSKPVAQTVRKFIDKNGEGVYEIAIEIDDIEAAHKFSKEHGVKIIAEPHPLPIFPPTKLMWISPKSTHGVFLEFIQGSGLYLEHTREKNKQCKK